LSRLATAFVLGYHGCDRGIGEKAINGKVEILQSDQDYDWLGPGAYFWQADPQIALEWAIWKVGRGDYEVPFVIGAVIDLRNCLDLCSRADLDIVRGASTSAADNPIPGCDESASDYLKRAFRGFPVTATDARTKKSHIREYDVSCTTSAGEKIVLQQGDAEGTISNCAPILDLEKLRSAELKTHPFEYVVVDNFVRTEWENRLVADFPRVRGAGSFPLATVKLEGKFSKLIDSLNGPEFRRAVENKFSLSLEDRPTLFTVRGRCRPTDGTIHTDSKSKIITVLLYMNPRWSDQGGRLRLLNSATNIEDVVAEIPPVVGTLLIFKRCDHSFHGHLPFDGERKVIQMNWVTEQKFVDRESNRHRWSALIKALRFS
jgi:SM-20-related protein